MLTHLDSKNQPGMVDISEKAVTQRTATAITELIPFCHPLTLDGIKVAIEFADPMTVKIECTVKTTHKTGVEMEALTGASVAALTIYDMCKSLTHQMVIKETRLLEKTGGKSDFRNNAE